MAKSYWMPVCKWCGKRNEFGSRTMDGDFPPIIKPELEGSRSASCSESPTKSHQVEWVRYK